MRAGHTGDTVEHRIATVHVWQLEARALPWALAAVSRDRRRVRSLPGARFAKLLTTSRGFTARDADLRRWMLVTSWSSAMEAADFENSPVADGWYARAEQCWRATLRPVSGRGRWARCEPFGTPTDEPTTGPVAALTRARLAPQRAAAFWRAVPPIAAQAGRHPGLLASVGFGEAPIGYQGTLSLWSSEADLHGFAYGSGAHSAAIARTRTVGWHAEELFWRFAVLDSYGTIDGCDPLSARR